MSRNLSASFGGVPVHRLKTDVSKPVSIGCNGRTDAAAIYFVMCENTPFHASGGGVLLKASARPEKIRAGLSSGKRSTKSKKKALASNHFLFQ